MRSMRRSALAQRLVWENLCIDLVMRTAALPRRCSTEASGRRLTDQPAPFFFWSTFTVLNRNDYARMDGLYAELVVMLVGVAAEKARWQLERTRRPASVASSQPKRPRPRSPIGQGRQG